LIRLGARALEGGQPERFPTASADMSTQVMNLTIGRELARLTDDVEVR
jgi:hypothetical protein